MDGTAPASETPALGSFAALREAAGVRWQDLAVVTPLVILAVVGTLQIDTDTGSRETDALAVACAVVGTASLLFWRRFGIAVVAVVAVSIAVYLGSNYTGGPALLAGPLALLALGYTASRRWAWIGAAVMAAAGLLGHILGEGVPASTTSSSSAGCWPPCSPGRHWPHVENGPRRNGSARPISSSRR